MPQDRTTLAANARWRVERVRFHEVAAQWSPVYRASSRRLVLPGSGALQWRRAAGPSWLIDSLTAFCVGGAEAYQLRPEREGDARSSVVVSEVPVELPPDGAGWQGFAALPDTGAWLLAPVDLYRLRLHWRSLEQHGGGAEATASLLPQLLRRSASAPALEEATPPVLRTRRLLLAQPGAALTLHAMAEDAHSSPFHLARSFRRHTGLSLHQYRQRLRMALALARLEEGERDLSGLALDLGFCSQSHFGAVFRREIGVSPAQARAALAGTSGTAPHGTARI